VVGWNFHTIGYPKYTNFFWTQQNNITHTTQTIQTTQSAHNFLIICSEVDMFW
jgi:hypothetical protein